MRALVLTQIYPAVERPTWGPYSVHTYRALKRFCDVRVVVPTPWWWHTRDPWTWVWPPTRTETGLPASYPVYWSLPAVTPLHGLVWGPSLARHVDQIRREFPFDVILSAWAYPDTVGAAYLAERARVPMITTVLGSDINDSASQPMLRWQIARAMKKAARVVSVSAALGERVIALGVPRDRVVTVHNGVDGETFRIRDKAEARAKLSLPAEGAIVTYAGNLLPVKGPDVLIDAIASIAKIASAPKIHFAIVGGGTEAEGIKRRAADLGVADRITFAGRVLPTAVPDYIAACDALVLPSRDEGCPNVVLEALASGRPVVGTTVGGVPELLRDGNGLLVPSERPAELGEALIQAVSRTWDPEALRRTVPALSWDAVGERYAKIIDEACASPPTR